MRIINKFIHCSNTDTASNTPYKTHKKIIFSTISTALQVVRHALNLQQRKTQQEWKDKKI